MRLFADGEILVFVSETTVEHFVNALAVEDDDARFVALHFFQENLGSFFNFRPGQVVTSWEFWSERMRKGRF